MIPPSIPDDPRRAPDLSGTGGSSTPTRWWRPGEVAAVPLRCGAKVFGIRQGLDAAEQPSVELLDRCQGTGGSTSVSCLGEGLFRVLVEK